MIVGQAVRASQSVAARPVSASIMAAEQSYTLNGLKRWCCNDPSLPNVASIKELHVYDFDNTIFQTPLPNKSLWEHSTWNRLQSPDVFAQGGWWHNVAVLSATGEGIEIEEPRAWQGHWNEKIVNLIKLSMQENDVLTVLLTGRSEGDFADLVQRICGSRHLEFDIYALKPLVSPVTGKKPSTMVFKQEFLTTLVRTYNSATNLKLYEDRAHHVRDFQSFFHKLSNDIRDKKVDRIPLDARVIQVAEMPGVLDPVAEAAAIQQAINEHNDAVRAGTSQHNIVSLKMTKTTLYTAYQIKSQQDSARLLSLVKLPETAKKLANSILITTYPADAGTIQRAGGLGRKLRFEVVSVGFLASRIWAVKVKSVGAAAFTKLSDLLVVLALNDDGRPHEAKLIKDWHPLPANSGFGFDAVVSDVFRLRIEEEIPAATSSAFPQLVPQKRSHTAINGTKSQSTSQFQGAKDASHNHSSRNQTKGHEQSTGRSYAQTARAVQHHRPRDSSARGSHSNRGRGRGYRDQSNRRASYKDHDATQESVKAGGGQSMHDNY